MSLRQVSASKKLALVLALLAYLLLFLLPALMLLPTEDEAMFLLQSKWMWQGELPYRDFFQLVFPGVLWLGQLAYAVAGGASVLAARLADLILMSVSAGLVLWMGRSYLKPVFRWALGLFFALSVVGNYLVFSHHTVSGSLAVLSAACVWRYLGWAEADDSEDSAASEAAVSDALSAKRAGKWLVFAGVLSALTLMTTQSLGALLVGFWLLFLWRLEPRTLAQFVPGFIAPLALWLGVMALQGIIPHWYRDTMAWLLEGNYSRTSQWGYFSVGLSELLHMGFDLRQPGIIQPIWAAMPKVLELCLIAALPLVGLIWALQLRVRHEKSMADFFRADRQSLLLGLAGLMIVSTLSYSTSLHIASNSWFAYLLAMMALQQWLTTSSSKKVAGILSLMLLIGVVYDRWEYQARLMLQPMQWLVSYGTLEPAFWAPWDVAQIMETATGVELIRQRTSESDPIFVINASPEFYLLSDRQNLTRFLVVYPGYTSDSQLVEIQRDLEAHPPALIVDDNKEFVAALTDPRFQAERGGPRRLKDLHYWINTNYQLYRLSPNLAFFFRY